MLPMWDGRTTNDKRTREDRATQPNGCWMAEFRNNQSLHMGQHSQFLLFFAKLSFQHPLAEQLYLPLFVVRRSSFVVCPSRIGNISIYLHYMMFQTIQTIYFLLGYDPGNVSATSKTNTKTKTHTKTNTKTKTGKNLYMHCLLATYYTSPES